MLARWIPRLAALSALLGGLISGSGPAALAQMSPNCERNGRKLACAYTPWPASSTAQREAGRVVFADHTIVELQLEPGSCRLQGRERLCKAWILAPAAAGQPQPARYQGTAYEGGYRHAYRSSKLQLTYWVLD